FDFAIYFTPDPIGHETLTDPADATKVTKQLHFTSGEVAVEFFNDPVGTLTTTVAPTFGGGFLDYHVAAHSDGTQDEAGKLSSNAGLPELTFGEPITADIGLLPLDAQGFPVDQFFYDPFVPFTLISYDSPDPATRTELGRMAGQLRMRFVPPAK